MSDQRRDEPDMLGRREFTLQSALALLAGVIITVDGCGGSSSSNTPTSPTPTPAPTPAPSAADVNGSVAANHGHVAVVTGAQITAGNALSLNIQGTATHPHTVDLTQADLGSLRNRQAVSKDSTNNNSHMHTVTFTPA
jgi:hypothetical protein